MKSWITRPVFEQILSLPSRERGLKYAEDSEGGKFKVVAPLAGAWIEITVIVRFDCPLTCRSPRGSVD